MLTPEEAWRRLSEHLDPLPNGPRTRRDALGATLGSSIVATTEIPASDVSAMDGYAIAGDVSAGLVLPVAGTVAAGDAPGARLGAGQALRIWTGAPIPVGADRVVPVELVDDLAPDRMRITRPVDAGAHIRRRGEILERGARLLEQGARLGPAALALLASQGLDEIEVIAAPHVAVIATGDEVVAADREPRPGQLRDSHTDYLLAAGRRLGLEFASHGIVGDEPEALGAALARALAESDVVLVCGGVSMGGRDYTPDAFAAVGAETIFAGVAIQPGKPLVAARRGAQTIFGLPGNPASVMVAFRLFVRPALERLLGRQAGFWSEARAVELAAPLAGGRPRDRFVPARRSGRGTDHELVEPLGVRGSHDLRTFGFADRLLRIRPDEAPRAAGELVEAIDWE